MTTIKHTLVCAKCGGQVKKPCSRQPRSIGIKVYKSTCCKGRIRLVIGYHEFCISKLEAFNLSSDVYKKLKTMVYGRQP
jgi:hypothetical protein